MIRYEYNIVPAPNRGRRAKGVKGTDARFAHAISELMNELGQDGWEYLRADTLPCEEKTGFTRRSVVYKTLLVFRRPMKDMHADAAPDHVADAPQLTAPEPEPEPEETGPKLGGASRADPGTPSPIFSSQGAIADRDPPDLIDENAPASDDASDGADDALLTKRDHSFATYSPRSRLPGVKTRD